MKKRFFLIPAVALLLATSCGNTGGDADTAASDSIEIETALSVDSAFNTPRDTASADTPAVTEEPADEKTSGQKDEETKEDTKNSKKTPSKKVESQQSDKQKQADAGKSENPVVSDSLK